MKITLFFLFIFCSFLAPKIYAQMTMIGVRTGVNLANEKYENLANGESISMRALFLAGAQVDYQVTNSLAISLQLLYDQKGTHAEMAGGETVGTADWTISYLEVPILAKIYLGNNIVRPYLFAGPSIGFLLRNTEKIHTYCCYIPFGVGASYSKDTVANITDSTSKFDFSLIAGVGISTTLDSGLELFLDAGYAFGLMNINNYNADKGKDYYIYSRDIRIAAGILFPLY